MSENIRKQKEHPCWSWLSPASWSNSCYAMGQANDLSPSWISLPPAPPSLSVCQHATVMVLKVQINICVSLSNTSLQGQSRAFKQLSSCREEKCNYCWLIMAEHSIYTSGTESNCHMVLSNGFGLWRFYTPFFQKESSYFSNRWLQNTHLLQIPQYTYILW